MSKRHWNKRINDWVDTWDKKTLIIVYESVVWFPYLLILLLIQFHPGLVSIMPLGILLIFPGLLGMGIISVLPWLK